MNNKGQTLVAFVLILPIFILLLITLIDVGTIQTEKNKYQSEVKNIIKYGLNHLEDENLEQKLTNLLEQNIDAETTLKIQNNSITINVKKEYSTIFKNLKTKQNTLNITYLGYIENNKITIIKE